MNYSFQTVINFLIAIFLFLLPWQTRWIYDPAFINNNFWEYGTKSLYGTELLLWFIFGLVLVQKIIRKQWLKIKLFYCFIVLLFVVFLGISVWLSSDRVVSLYFAVRVIEGAGLVLLIKECNASLQKLLLAFWAGGVVQGIFAIMQFFSQEIFANKWFGLASHSAGTLGSSVVELSQERWLRAYGSFGWPNSLGIYLAIIWILGFILYSSISNKKFQALITGGQLIVLSGLILSFSRGAWMAALGGLIVLYAVLVTIKQYNNTTIHSTFFKKIFYQLSYSLLLIFLFLITLWPLFTTRFNTTTRLENRSVAERVSQYSVAGKIINQHPLFGVGPGAYTSYLHQKNPTLAVWDLQPVHNVFILGLAEVGVVVSLLCCFIVILLLKYVWKYDRIFLSILVVLFIAGLFDHWLWSMSAGYWLWFIVCGFSLKSVLIKRSMEKSILQEPDK